MDASHEPPDARRNAARPRSAPNFCRPEPAAPRPYYPGVRAGNSATIGGNRSTVSETPPRPTFRGDSGSESATSRSEGSAKFGTVRSVWGSDEPDRDDDPHDREPASWSAIGRGVALLLGTLLLVDLFAGGGLAASGPWWLDTYPLPRRLVAGLLGTVAAGLLLFAVRGVLPRGIRGVSLLCVGLLIAIALKNTTVYYGLLKRGDLHAGPPVAFSLHVIGCLGMVLFSIRAAPGLAGLRGTLLAFIGFGAAALALPIAHIACQGTIDARQSAATVIVAGPRPFEAGAEIRMRQRIGRAVELHEAGLVPNLVLTATDNARHLASMRERALAAGVPAQEIEVIPEAHLPEVLETLATRYSGINGEEPVLLVVSDPDHLPRLLLAGRGAAVRLAGVPTKFERRPARSVYLREIFALWRCYLRR